MATFVLIPGADGRSWFWHRVCPELQRRGHEAIAVELPLEGTAGLEEYAGAVVRAAEAAARSGASGRPVIVGQSLGAFTAPLVCDRLQARLLVLLNPMVPKPGETGNDWWAATGQGEAQVAAARRDGRPEGFDLRRDFFHDVPDDVTEAAFADTSGVADLTTVFTQPWPLTRWPRVPTRVLQGKDDRFFPLDFQRRVVRERLGAEIDDVLPGGHLLASSHPAELAERLDARAAAVA